MSSRHGTGIGAHTAIKGRYLAIDNTSSNMLLTALRALGERANAELKQRWKCLRRIRLFPAASATSSPPASSHQPSQRDNSEKPQYARHRERERERPADPMPDLTPNRVRGRGGCYHVAARAVFPWDAAVIYDDPIAPHFLLGREVLMPEG